MTTNIYLIFNLWSDKLLSTWANVHAARDERDRLLDEEGTQTFIYVQTVNPIEDDQNNHQ